MSWFIASHIANRPLEASYIHARQELGLPYTGTLFAPSTSTQFLTPKLRGKPIFRHTLIYGTHAQSLNIDLRLPAASLVSRLHVFQSPISLYEIPLLYFVLNRLILQAWTSYVTYPLCPQYSHSPYFNDLQLHTAAHSISISKYISPSLLSI